MTRIRWTEKARRLAEKYDLYDMGESEIEHNLNSNRGISAFGIVTEDGHHIVWTLKDDLIDCQVELR